MGVNANVDRTELPSHAHKRLLSQKQKIPSVGGDVEKLRPGGLSGNAKWCSHYEEVWSFLKNLKTELLLDPTRPHLGINPKELKTRSQRDVFIPGVTHNSQEVEASQLPTDG